MPLFDGLGSERAVTDSTQAVTGTLMTEGFGQTVATTGSSSSPYMFAATSGYRTEGDAGLMHVGARYYDAQVGRFITRDTVLSEHPYIYCNGNPVNAVDPTGHDWGRDLIHYGENIAVGAVGVVAGIVFVPATATVGVVVGAGLLIGAVTGGLIAANNYYWGHPDPETWDNGDLGVSVGIGVVVGAAGGGVTAGLKICVGNIMNPRIDSTDGLWGRGSIRGWD